MPDDNKDEVKQQRLPCNSFLKDEEVTFATMSPQLHSTLTQTDSSNVVAVNSYNRNEDLALNSSVGVRRASIARKDENVVDAVGWRGACRVRAPP